MFECCCGFVAARCLCIVDIWETCVKILRGLDLSLLQAVVCPPYLKLFVKYDSRVDSFPTVIFSALSLRELPGDFWFHSRLGQVFSVGRFIYPFNFLFLN